MWALDCSSLQQKFSASKASNIQDENLLLRLSTTDGSNAPQQRELSIKRKVFANHAEKMMVKILSPADLQGVGILTLTSTKQKITQWLYLPQTLQTKRILNSQKKSKFAGSEFTYEDLLPFDFKHYNCESVSKTNLGQITAVLKPQTPSAFTTLTVQFDETHWQLQKIHFLDPQNHILRTATFDDYRQVANEDVRPFRITMMSTEHNRESTLEILKLNINTNLADAEFTMQALTR